MASYFDRAELPVPTLAFRRGSGSLKPRSFASHSTAVNFRSQAGASENIRSNFKLSLPPGRLLNIKAWIVDTSSERRSHTSSPSRLHHSSDYRCKFLGQLFFRTYSAMRERLVNFRLPI